MGDRHSHSHSHAHAHTHTHHGSQHESISSAKDEHDLTMWKGLVAALVLCSSSSQKSVSHWWGSGGKDDSAERRLVLFNIHDPNKKGCCANCCSCA